MYFSNSVLATCSLLAATVEAATPLVNIDIGVVAGTTTSLPTASASVNQFLGIPFALSPPQRFSPPQPPAPSENIINATTFKPSCIQQFVYPQAAQEFTELVFNSPAPQESEDCLYLNVFAPSTPAGGNGRAVMFWIYGGGLQFGNAGQPGYDGSHFAAYEDVIVVTTNYRTNVFGFPSSPELPLTGHNLGFLDQRMALDWVQNNIGSFGGDPSKVTIFGESAGGFSVDALITSYPRNSTPPFRAAICESGQYSVKTAPATTLANQIPAWYALSAALNCPGNYSSNLTCVRAASATKIQTIIDQQIIEFNPIPDNITYVSDPMARRMAGNIANVPVLGGTNAQEGRVFAVGQTNATAYLQTLFGNNASSYIQTVLAAYPPNSTTGLQSQYDIAAQVFTEFFFQCPQAIWANSTAAAGIPAWRYYFNASFENTQMYPNLGVYHSSEIGLVFNTHLTANTTTQENALATFMQGAWARFARNPAGGPGWNPVGSGVAGQVLQGPSAQVPGGLYLDASSSPIAGAYDLGVLGNVGNTQGGGVTVLDQSAVDYRCGLFTPVYNMFTT